MAQKFAFDEYINHYYVMNLIILSNYIFRIHDLYFYVCIEEPGTAWTPWSKQSRRANVSTTYCKIFGSNDQSRTVVIAPPTPTPKLRQSCTTQVGKIIGLIPVHQNEIAFVTNYLLIKG